VTYNESTSVLHGGQDYGYAVYEFHLEPKERIMEVHTQLVDGFLHTSLVFFTNKGRWVGLCERHRLPTIRPMICLRSSYLACLSGTVQIMDGQPVVGFVILRWAHNHFE